MSQKEAIEFAQKIAQEKKAAAKEEKAVQKEVRPKLIEIRRIAFRDAIREVYGNGYYKE